MRRWALWGAIWLLGAIGSMTLACFGVMVVANEVTERPPTALTERAVNREAQQPAPPAGGEMALPPPPPSAGPALAPPGKPAQAPPAEPARFSPSSAGSARSGSTPEPAAPAAPAGNPPLQGKPPGSATTRTISSTGGTVAVRYDPGGAVLLWAKPNAGFTMEVKSQGPQKVEVRFEAEDHKSRVEAWWASGPQQSVREDRD